MKNWNIQGRAKIKDLDMKKMKVEIKKILNETDEEKFLYLVDAYCNKLETANETAFLNYLKKNYFQSNRTQMWAHCYRKNAGVNTNMSVESLNNFLKNNQLKRRANVTVEKLLDTID
ncbi:uncharacterized protein LOC111692391 isoform X2 [Anoplophora glabripennis]|uniref:uncharacterized protein LOC108915126 isoform X2 n=1 Tax=Anoplophora glabripennis TaxID=217634 RepID=UPI000875934A|nr:uncharacterized protein LOC108915126 isoform X2 [Anoplophora glabripennis]XP_023312150.1 uncharacterized protein LOC111692391 isoform X2 [Anoplophora glabripennis]